MPRRSVIREDEFEEQLRALIPDAEAADDFTMAAESILSEDPEVGLPVSRDGLIWYFIRFTQSACWKGVAVFCSEFRLQAAGAA